MKKVITVLAAIMISAMSFAQFSIGVQGIANLSNAKTNTEGVLNAVKSGILLPGVGVVAEISLGKNLSVRPGVNYLQQGFKLKGEISGDLEGGASYAKFEGKNTLSYIQLPVNVVYSIPLGKNQVQVGAGAYTGYGITGKSKMTIILDDHEVEGGTMEENPFKKGGEGAGLKRSDFGVNALAGIRFSNGFFANLGYQLGISDISGDDDGGYKNCGVQLSIGYFFRNK